MKRKILLTLTAVILLFCTSCSLFVAKKTPGVSDIIPHNENGEEIALKKAEKIVSDMTLREKIYQMLFVTPESITGMGQVIAAGETTKNALNEYPVGGIIYFSPNLQTPKQTKEMISNSQSYSKIPLFIGVDEEGGRVSRAGSVEGMNISKIEPMRQVADEKRAYEIGATLGGELSKLGFNLDFAPVADIVTNPENTEIGDRSFGASGEDAAVKVAAVVKGLGDKNVFSVIKHFPGHGSTQNDSHKGYSESTRTKEELYKNELLPFISGIDAGADFVMISHATFTNVTKEKCPASLSKEIITDILINEMGFEGIVITDSFSMGAITENYKGSKAAVKAINAGVDMILMPSDVKGAFEGIMSAVESGELTEKRIDESVLKIIGAKITKGLFNK